ncbi:MAG: hypothetical protein WAV45_13645, partial [Propionibacteriaceae bacterium]
MGIFDGIKDAIHNVENAVTGHGAASTHDPLQDAGVPNQADAIAEALTAQAEATAVQEAAAAVEAQQAVDAAAAAAAAEA